MASSPQSPAPSLSLRSAIARALMLLLLVGLTFAALRWTALGDYFEGDRLARLLDRLRHTYWAAPVLVSLYTVLSPLGLPVSPLLLAGGALFGLAGGSLFNLIGLLLGAMASFLVGRFLGRDLVLHLVSPRHLSRAESVLEEHGFWAMVRIRFIPIPFALINYGAAIAGVEFRTFVTATAVGLVLPTVIYTTIGHALANATTGNRSEIALIGGLSILGLLLLTFVPALLRLWSDRKAKP